ncbi:uncharacterized protein [Dysidea avara]|uniref:uncharacterized protein n=1 Tax=Dysidea avara TaxID=196820 RepID=UPI00331924AA
MTQLSGGVLLIVLATGGLVLGVIGNCSPSLLTVQYDDIDSVEITKSQYCFVNECTIRINDSNVLLNIINNTGDWIMATNTTNLFIAPNTGTKCMPHLEHTFSFLVIVGSIIISSSSINIVIHIIIKELHTVAGAMIVVTCASINISCVFQLITAVFQYLHPVHDHVWICAVSKYGVILFLFLYEIAKVTYLTHFGCLMYRSYKMVTRGINNRTLLRTYFITTVAAALFCTALIIVIDLAGDKSSLTVTSDGYCAGFFNHFAATRIVLLFLIGTTTLLQVIIFLIAITFYLMVKKQCCGKGPSDARVSITLMSTIGLNTILLISLLLAGVEGESTVIATSVATSVEQVTLLLIFVTYQYTRKRLWLMLQKHCKYLHFKRKEEAHMYNPPTHDMSESTL